MSKIPNSWKFIDFCYLLGTFFISGIHNFYQRDLKFWHLNDLWLHQYSQKILWNLDDNFNFSEFSKIFHKVKLCLGLDWQQQVPLPNRMVTANAQHPPPLTQTVINYACNKTICTYTVVYWRILRDEDLNIFLARVSKN